MHYAGSASAVSHNSDQEISVASRRQFLLNTAQAVAATALAFMRDAFSAPAANVRDPGSRNADAAKSNASSIGRGSPGFTLQRTGASYPKFEPAHAAAQHGDTILINPTAYPGQAFEVTKDLTLRSSVPGQRWTASSQILNNYHGGSQSIVVEDAAFRFLKRHPNFYYGPTNAPLCVYWSGETKGSLTVRNCVFEDCPMPILTSRWVTDVLIENCEFINCGSTDEPNTHCLYVHATHELTVRGCRFRWTYTIPEGTAPIPAGAPYNGDKTWVGVGHAIKSRSNITTVQACFIDNRLGSTSAMIDVGEAGSLTVEGNIILE